MLLNSRGGRNEGGVRISGVRAASYVSRGARLIIIAAPAPIRATTATATSATSIRVVLIVRALILIFGI